VPVTVEKPKTPVIPLPEPIQTQKVEWFVVTPQTLPKGDFVLFAVTPASYEKLSLNEAETLRWAKEAYWRLSFYKEAQ